MRRRIGVERIYADNLVICPRRKVFPIGRKSHGVDGARVVAEGGQLSGLGVVGVLRVQDGFGGPNAHVAVCGQNVSQEPRGGALRATSAG